MKLKLLALIFILSIGYMMYNESSKYSYTEIKTKPITEEECWIKGGSWEFIEMGDAYGTDLSGFTCIIN